MPPQWGSSLVSDERLIARVRAGDMRAFEAIYDRYERPIRTFCRHLLGRPEDADDAVQHTFLAAYRTITGSEKRLELKPWLFTVARNRCRSLLRSRRSDPCVTGDAPEPSTEGLTAAVERRESLRHMLADIASLPEDQRAALILTQLETLRHDEVARVLEVPTDKVKALVFQARTSLMHAREARDTACGDIREQLVTLSGPALRRGNLKRHLRLCTGCRDFELKLRQQHSVILVLLPLAAHPTLRQQVLGQASGGGAGAAAAGSGTGAGAGSTAGGLLAKGAALKLGAVAVVSAAGAAIGIAGPGTVAAVAGDAFHGGHHRGTLESVQYVGRSATGHTTTRTISLRTSDRPVNRTASDPPVARQPQATAEVESRHDHSAGGHLTQGSAPETNESAANPGDGGGADVPPGLAKKGGTPPGLAKKGGTPPGLAKKGGTPPGQSKKLAAAPPGKSGGKGKSGDAVPPGQAKKTPAPTGGPTTGVAPPGSPAGGRPDPPGQAVGGGNGNGNGGGNGNGNAGGNGNGHGGGHGGGS
jgi:RNA polymerase sigma factor (sigma-70 family)